MKSFEEERQEYFKKLGECLEFIINTPKNKKLLKILQNPKNEEELNYANKCLRYFQDCRNLKQYCIEENIKEIDFRKFLIVDIFLYLIKCMNNNEGNTSIENEKILKVIRENTYLQAEIVYEIFVLSATQLETLEEIIKDKCNIDTNSIQYRLISLSILIDWTEKFEELIDERYIINKKNMDKFHELCVNGINKNSDSKHDELLDTLIYSYKKRK